METLQNIPLNTKEIVQLGGLAVVGLGILYILFTFIKEHRNELQASREERLKNYAWFTGYVSENNHDQTERFKEHTQALVQTTVESTKAMNVVAENIKTNTDVTKKTLDILEKHSLLLERLYDKIKDKK